MRKVFLILTFLGSKAFAQNENLCKAVDEIAANERIFFHESFNHPITSFFQFPGDLLSLRLGY